MPAEKKEFAPEMILIPEAAFLMGNEEGQDNEKPVHRVWVDGFMIGKFPVTNREYRIFVEETGVEEAPFWSEKSLAHPDKPVVGASWYDAMAYCKWLSHRTRKHFRLPTEAQWERAARGGLEGKRYPWGNGHPSERPFSGYDLQTGGPERVGRYEPNGFELYDMAGGVHEWCSDFYDPHYYHNSPERNPQGPPSGKRRVSRGGSWRHRVKFSRCAARSSLNPSSRYADYGFRVAINL
ncbi:MAG: formylglycine-generating enzyme family protein [Deltaproteobacteria bacterium]|nr:formylglycine-generating enzyme family protein [Deltaproteobacteria bacterium]